MRRHIWLCALGLLCPLGCQHIGPGTIVEDRVAYDDAVASSWKEQTLLNIVKFRYFDTPFFTDVAQIVSGYSVGAGQPGPGLHPIALPGGLVRRSPDRRPAPAGGLHRPPHRFVCSPDASGFHSQPDSALAAHSRAVPDAGRLSRRSGLRFDAGGDQRHPGPERLRRASPPGEPRISTHCPDPAQGPGFRQRRDANRSWQGQDPFARHVLPRPGHRSGPGGGAGRGAKAAADRSRPARRSCGLRGNPGRPQGNHDGNPLDLPRLEPARRIGPGSRRPPRGRAALRLSAATWQRNGLASRCSAAARNPKTVSRQRVTAATGSGSTIGMRSRSEP